MWAYVISFGSFLKHCSYLSNVLTNNYRLKDHYTFYFTEKRATSFIRIAESCIGCKSRQLDFYRATNYTKTASLSFGSFLKHCSYLSNVLTNNYRLKDHYTFYFTEKRATSFIRIAESCIGCKSRQLDFYKLYETSFFNYLHV